VSINLGAYQTAAYNRAASGFFLNIAKSEPEGRLFSCKASIIFSAFAMEAFLNTLGSLLFKNEWKHKHLGIEDKLDFIALKINIKLDKSKHPYSTIKEIFRFRNLVAHGADEIVEFQKVVVNKSTTASYLRAVEGKWEKLCTIKKAQRAYDDVSKLAELLSQKAKIKKFPGFPFGNFGSAEFVVKDHIPKKK
jgi:hypothetical protein